MVLEYGDLLKEIIIRENGSRISNRAKDFLGIKQVLIEESLKIS